ncbi:hypothetical protein GCM10010174_79340 [Kutzneria viridogrisea]|uniref:Amino acid adenylation domain-containing protein n=1 Tax=Kutzneria viridogrisea TaxID=47990 RepID=A0ABR6BBG0_9PSEU|nr:amino acid adenylation domain-containing protein [Kutzneria viridogrisea]
MTPDQMESWLIDRIARHVGRAAADIDPDEPLASYGLSSRDAVGMIGELETVTARTLSPALIWEHPTIRQLSRHIADVPVPAPAVEASEPPAGAQEPIAVVGVGCRFPGADGPEEFWRLLADGVDAVAASPRRAQLPGAHGLLEDIETFDAEFFALSARETPYVDPQQRLLLEVAWRTLESAGTPPDSLAGSQTGVFVGISVGDYTRVQTNTPEQLTEYSGTGSALSVAANRMSYFFDFRGPSVAVDTACSSSLVAVHMACESLRAGESTLALAGGVNLIVLPEVTEILTKAGMMAPDGRCKTFDAAADGYVRAEGCGLLALKTLSAARRDGDQVLAVIRGSAVNHDGRSNGLAAPNGQAQREVIRSALQRAAITPAEVDYVEAHGTGTALGDPIEIRALTDVLAEGRDAEEPVLVGSVKTNIGHAESAAGIAGLIKVILMLRHRQVPPHLHLSRINPDVAAKPVRIPLRLSDWPRRLGARTAGVSGFGFGGSNAHVIVQEATEQPATPDGVDGRTVHVLALSARTESALDAARTAWGERLRGATDVSVEDACVTANTGRQHFTHRLAVVGGDRAQLADQLLRRSTSDVHNGIVRLGQSGKLAFLFSGQGAQFSDMARQLYTTNPWFRRELDQCDEVLGEYWGRSLSTVLFPDPADRGLLDQTRYTQPALFAIEYALARLWQSWGIEPDYLLGHSVGELAAACVAGVFDLEQGLRLAAERGRLVQELVPPGAMLAVFTEEQAVRAMLDEWPGLAVAAVNGSRNVAVAGASTLVATFAEDLAERGIDTRPLNSTYPFHTPAMAAAGTAFGRAARAVPHSSPRIPLVSDLDGRLFDAEHVLDASYWERHLTQPVRYADGIRLLAGLGCDTYLEVGPGRTLIGAGQREVTGRLWLASLRPTIDDWAVLSDSLAQLYVSGRPVDWAGHHRGQRARKQPMPGHHFDRQRHWFPLPGDPHHERPAERAEVPVLTAQPSRDVHTVLAETVGRLLHHHGPVDPHASFLELGADSMTLFQTLQTVQETFQVRLPVSRLFEELNTVDRLAAYITENAPKHVLDQLITPAPVPVAAQPRTAPAPANGAAPDDAVGQFLSVHERVMAQAYELLQGRKAPLPPRPAEPQTQQTKQRETYVAFQQTEAKRSGAWNAEQHAFAEEFVRRFCARTAGSKQQAIQERAYHADVRHAPQPHIDLRETRYPIAVTRSQGARMWDVDGNEYLDLTMGFGVNLFGHNESFINEAIAGQLAHGMQLGPHPLLAAEVAELVCEMTGKQRAVFCNTGSEAVMVAVRLARAVSGRTKVALFAGSYHGSADPILARQDPNGRTGDAAPLAPGVPAAVGQDTLILPYGEDEALAVLRDHVHELAAVLVEPVQSRKPELQPVEFLRQLREITAQAGVALIFDEVITGFRVHPGGAQALFDVPADLAVYGKIIGGGLPIGMVAGNSEYLDAIDGGAWGFGNTPYPQSVRTFFTGTFCKHPLALAASRAVLREMRRRGPGLHAELNQRVEGMADRLNAMCREAGVPIAVVNFGSLFRLRFPEEPMLSETVELFHLMLVERGLYIWEGRNCFLSTAHTDEDVDRIVSIFADTVNELRAHGFFPGSKAVADQPGGYPLTDMQREFWLLNQIGPEQARVCVETALLELRGELRVDALRESLQDLVRRHDTLRTTFAADGSEQLVAHSLQLDVPVLDFSADPAARVQWLTAQTETTFDLTAAPLVRVAVLKIADDRHQLHVAAHHTVLDGWSFVVLFNELEHLYNTRVSLGAERLAPAPRYQEFVDRRLRYLSGEDAARDRAYWLNHFPNGVPTLRLPTDRPRPPRVTYHGGQVPMVLGQDVATRLAKTARELGNTPFTILLGAYALLLHRVTGDQDVVIGVPIALREDKGADRLVGNCGNMVPVRSRLTGAMTVADFLTSLRQDLFAAHDHAAYPFAELRTEMLAGVDGTRAQLINTTFNLDNAVTAPQLDGLSATLLTAESHYAKADIEVDMVSMGDEIRAVFKYNADLFDEPTIRGHVATFALLLDAFLTEADQHAKRIPMITAAASATLHQWEDGGTATISDTTLHALFEERVERAPDALAVLFEQEKVTCAELNARANQLARLLANQGVAQESVVGLMVPRSIDMVVAVLAVLKAGAAYLPIDIAYPDKRVKTIVSDARPRLVVTTSEIASRLGLDCPVVALDEQPQAEYPTENLARTVTPANPAYVLYTSGSTGKPKGVVMSHESLVNLFDWSHKDMAVEPGAVVAQFASLGFDASAHEIFSALLYDKVLAVPTEEVRRDARKLAEWLELFGVGELHVPNLVLEAVCEAAEELGVVLPELKVVTQAGEALTPSDRVRRFFDAVEDRRLFNHYGPSETHVVTTAKLAAEVADWPVNAPIGRPISNTRSYVLDEEMQAVPPGVVGNLYAAGVGLAHGYLNMPARTAEVFLPDPFGEPGTRMYRTGDLARWLPDGQLEFFGRADRQVKVRGNRVEPGEVELALDRQPGVSQAAVVGRGDVLVAYIVAAAGSQVDAAALRDAVRECLPDYMVPSLFVPLESLPLTQNGKLDTKALPDPLEAARVNQTEYVAPRTDTETVLAAIWADVLGVDRVGVSDDFFLIGGHSLAVTRVISKIRAELGSEVPIRWLFDAPTIAGLAALLDGPRTTSETRPELCPRVRPNEIPLSYAQSRLWFLNRLEGPNPTYNMALPVRLTGELDLAALTAAVQDVVARHETLRTRFVELDGQPTQQVLDSAEATVDVTVQRVDRDQVEQAVERACEYPFDLTTDLPLRICLFQVRQDEHVLVIVVHHIAGDAWSASPLAQDLGTAYAARRTGTAPTWQPLPVQYVDYTLWQRELLGSEEDPGSVVSRQLAFWRERLAGIPLEISLPVDRRRPAVASFRGDSVDFVVPAEVHAGLARIAAEWGASLFMVVRAGLAVLLSRLGGGTDVVVGSPVAGRLDEGVADLVGFFVNTLVLRVDVSGDPTFGELVGRVRDGDVGALEHQDVPFERLVEVLNPERSLARHPLFQVMLAFDNTSDFQTQLVDLDATEIPRGSTAAKVDLVFQMRERRGSDGTPAGIVSSLEYATDLFDRSTIERITTYFLRALTAVVAEPDIRCGAIDLLSPAEHKRLSESWTELARPVPVDTIPDLFEAQVERTPDGVAVVCGTDQVTFRDLNDRANQVAHHLRRYGLGNQSRVGVLMDRSTEMIAAVVGIWKAGASPVPLPSDMPVRRRDAIIAEARVTHVLAHRRLAEDLDNLDATTVLVNGNPKLDNEPTDNSGVVVRPHDMLTTVFTSGSSGTPKGVMFEHHNLVSGFAAYDETYRLRGRVTSILQMASEGFSVFTFDLVRAILSGARLVLCPQDLLLRPAELFDLMRRERVDCAEFVPAVIKGLVAHLRSTGERLDFMKVLIVASDTLYADELATIKELTGPDCVVVNQYGMTECTTDSTFHPARAQDSEYERRNLIGKPFPNTVVYVLDESMRPVPQGVPGELYVGGEGLSRGYLDRPDLTAERFLPDPITPLPGTRLYRTGDLGRQLADGSLELFGRADRQVKVRGNRVEPGEVELVLERQPGVSQAAVVGRGDVLVAYIVAAAGSQVDPAALRDAVRDSLPDYMVPSLFVPLESLPLTQNGKLDTRALPDTLEAARVNQTEYLAPRTDTETALAAIWAEVLGVDRVGVAEDFFLIGGHSLLATTVLAAVRDQFKVEIPLRRLFENPTVAALAREIADQLTQSDDVADELDDLVAMVEKSVHTEQ